MHKDASCQMVAVFCHSDPLDFGACSLERKKKNVDLLDLHRASFPMISLCYVLEHRIGQKRYLLVLSYVIEHRLGWKSPMLLMEEVGRSLT